MTKNLKADETKEWHKILFQGGDPEKIDAQLHEIMVQQPDDPALAFSYNEFRIANLYRLPRSRPQILLGGLLDLNYPNLHSFNLFKVADVVCLTAKERPYPYFSALFCGYNMLFFDLLRRLPRGFTPDFYWDNQIEHKHYIPAGIETAPFPIVASLCHIHLHKSVEHICELFDRIIPPSRYYEEILKKKYPGKTITMPFGLNWASFEGHIKPCWEKQIDVCVTFGENESPIYDGKRNQVIKWMKKFKEQYGKRFSILFATGMTASNYIETLRKSRITINVSGVHGPYNYRTVEAICAGSMVYQYDWEDPCFQNHFSELFIDGTHGASFTEETFEKKLLYYLENPAVTEKIARDAHQFLLENYSYKTLYERLIHEVKGAEIELPRKVIDKRGYFHRDMAYYNQGYPMMQQLMNFGVLALFDQPAWIRANNLMIYSQTLNITNIGHLMLVAMSEEALVYIKNSDFWELGVLFYEMAKRFIPAEFLWILQWNFFLISFDANKTSQKDIEEMITTLEKVTPTPFDEIHVMFKYEASKRGFPNYNLPEKPSDFRHLFTRLNIDLIRSIDNSCARAQLHHNYALEITRGLLSEGHV